jgi:hypothetical protein
VALGALAPARAEPNYAASGFVAALDAGSSSLVGKSTDNLSRSLVGANYHTTTLAALAGLRVTGYAGRLAPWAAAHFGYGWTWADAGAGTSHAISEGALAMRGSAGIDFMLDGSVGLGIFVDVLHTFGRPEVSTQVQLTAVDIGLRLKLKY